MTSPISIKRIVIVGGGTAGWMTAAALSKALHNLNLDITLVECDEIGTVGVGEATIPAIHSFNAMLGINQPEFMRFCNATFKLGIQFINWGALGDSYLHPFTRYGQDLNNVHFHQLWFRYAGIKAAEGEISDIDDYNLCCRAALAHRFSHPVSDQPFDFKRLNFAYHFDASLYARYLRQYSEASGVKRIEGKIVKVTQDSASGFIRSVTINEGPVIEGDLFIDCSGFRGLLIEETLHTGYDDWIRFLPCNRAVAVPSRNISPPVPYTRSTADDAGWRWRIPLQHRTGNGYVYSNDHISDDEAEARLLSQLEGEPLAAPRRIRFVTGKRRQVWNRNVVAVGLAAGFMEPLESTSIHLIQTAILRILAFFPDKNFAPADIENFNHQTTSEYERIRDFLILHYKATTRDDTPFWRQCRDMEVPDTLTRMMETFRAHGRLSISLDHLFTDQSWLSVMLGQGMKPQARDPLAENIGPEALEAHMRAIRDRVQTTLNALPSHQDYIAHFCAASEGVRA